LRVLLGYNYFPHAVDVRSRVEAWVARLRDGGFDVECTPLTPDPPAPAFPWPALDSLWRRRDPKLLRFYEGLAGRAEGFDAFVNCNGVNLHPEFVRELGTFTVYACFDDPESSEALSRPVAASYDLAMVGNVACLEMYRGWGVREVRWWPIGFHPYDFDPSLTKEEILSGRRDVDVALLCERASGRRSDRLDRFREAFPHGVYRGAGWADGFLPEVERVPLLRRTKIGPNIHNSIGPVNSRTFILPANGVLQVCDNRSHLGAVFEPGKEVVGFDTIDEAIASCRHFLEHDEERRAIAAAGWERAHRDYNEIAVFRRLLDAVREVRPDRPARKDNAVALSSLRRRNLRGRLDRACRSLKDRAGPLRSALRNAGGSSRTGGGSAAGGRPGTGARTLAGKRVLLVLGNLELGGSERQALLLARHLRNRCDAEVRVLGLVGGPGGAASACDEEGIPWRGNLLRRRDGRAGRFADLLRFAGAVREERPDAVLPYTWLPNYVCGLTWRMSGARTCIWNQRDEGLGAAVGRLARVAARMTPRYLANSEGGRTFLADALGVSRNRIRVVRNGVLLPPPREDRRSWRERIGVENGRVLALMLASIHPHKDHDTLLRAWRLVLEREGGRGRSPVLLLAGRSYGFEGGLKALAYDLGLGDSVRFLGPVDDVAGLLGAVDLCVHSTRTEGLPNAVLEAMSAGVPVVATDLPGVREAVGEHGFRFLAPREDAGALADRILEFAGSERLRAETGEVLRERAGREFGADAMCRAVAEVILEALGGGA